MQLQIIRSLHHFLAVVLSVYSLILSVEVFTISYIWWEKIRWTFSLSNKSWTLTSALLLPQTVIQWQSPNSIWRNFPMLILNNFLSPSSVCPSRFIDGNCWWIVSCSRFIAISDKLLPIKISSSISLINSMFILRSSFLYILLIFV